MAAYHLAQRNLALQLYHQYVENYERQYNNTFSFKHLENQEYFVAKEDDLEFKRKLKVAEIGENFDVSKMTKVVAGKKLWNYDALEPTEKKGAI